MEEHNGKDLAFLDVTGTKGVHEEGHGCWTTAHKHMPFQEFNALVHGLGKRVEDVA
jgi:hypothetical protein